MKIKTNVLVVLDLFYMRTSISELYSVKMFASIVQYYICFSVVQTLTSVHSPSTQSVHKIARILMGVLFVHVQTVTYFVQIYVPAKHWEEL